MNALPCPACGYRLQGWHFNSDRGMLVNADLMDGEPSGTGWRTWFECDQCEATFERSVSLSPDGVGPERLVPVEVGA